jgi:mono/diheme cytochrome c family protein
MVDTSEQLHLFEKDKLKSCETSRKSLMPAYNRDMLSDQDLDDIIAYIERVAAP